MIAKYSCFAFIKAALIFQSNCIDSLEDDEYVILLHIFRSFEIKMSLVLQYACRKTLADSRPRVRGRFAKNDDFGDASHRHINGRHHEEDDYDEVSSPSYLLQNYCIILIKLLGNHSKLCENAHLLLLKEKYL